MSAFRPSLLSRALVFGRIILLLALLLGNIAPASAAARPTSAWQWRSDVSGQTLGQPSSRPAGPPLDVTSTDTLVGDADGDGRADPGDTLRYTVVVTNSSGSDLANVEISAPLDAHTSLVGGSELVSPLAFADSYDAVQNTVLAQPAPGLLQNDSSPMPLSAVPASGTTTAGGAFLVGADGSFSYTPPSGYTGADSFTYAVTSAGGADTAAVTLAVRSVPTAGDDSYQVTRDTPRTVAAPGVLANDGGYPMPTPTAFSGPTAQGGSVTLNADGSFSYTPPSGYTGADSFTYTITNAAGAATATVNLLVGNQPGPSADAYTAASKTPLAVAAATGLLANDALGAPAGTIASFGGASAGGSVTTHAAGTTATFGDGSLRVDADGSFDFTPATGFSGVFSFSYRVANSFGVADATVTIAVQEAPVAAADPSFVALSEQPLAVTTATGLLANDALGFPAATVATFGGGALSAAVGDYAAGTPVSFGTSGALQVNADGSFSFTSDAGFSGSFSFQYALSNAAGASSATVTIFVRAVPAAAADAYTMTAGSTLAVNGTLGLLNNDTGTPAPAVASFGGGSLGGTVADHAAGSTAPLGADGTLQVNADGSLSVTPATGFAGTLSFDYQATNAAGSATATVTIAVQQGPIPVADSFTIAPGASIAGASLTANDNPGVPAAALTSVGGGDLSADVGDFAVPTTQSVAGVGGLVVRADGTFDFTPDAAFEGTFRFSYHLANAVGSADGLVTIQVDRNPAPVADSYTTPFQTQLTTPAATGLLANDALGFPAGTIASFGGGSLGGDAGSHTAGGTVLFGTDGALSVDADGAFDFTPPTGFAGTFTFSYRLLNPRSSADATVTIGVFKAPTAADDLAYTTLTGASQSWSGATGLLANDDIGIPAAAIATFGGGALGGLVTDHAAGASVTLAGGTLTVNADGSFTLANPTVSGAYTFAYRIVNGSGSSDALVRVEVRELPAATADGTYSVNVGATLALAAGSLTANDTAGFPAATIVSFGTADATSALTGSGDTLPLAGGTLTVHADGSFTLAGPTTPGTVIFRYRLENINGSADAQVTVEVRQPPTAANDGLYTVAAGSTLSRTAGDPDDLRDNDTLGSPTATIVSFGATDAGAAAAGSSIALAGGTLTVNADGSFTLASPTTAGDYSFTYRLGNAGGTPPAGGTSDATVAVQVQQAPNAVDDAVAGSSSPGAAYHTALNTTLTSGNLLGNDTLGYPAATLVSFGAIELAKPDGSGYNAAIGTVQANAAGTTATFGAGGSLRVNADGSFSFTPPTNYTGLLRFGYRIANASGTDDALVTFAVGARPTVGADTYPSTLVGNLSVDSAQGTPWSVLANDSGDRLTLALGSPSNGSATLNSNGTFVFNPTAGYEGDGGFTYSVTNGFGTVSGTLSLTISGMVWFIDGSAASEGDGRLATPFKTVSAFAAVNNALGNNPGAGDTIFVYSGSYSGNLALLNDQKLVGQGATASLSSIIGLTPPAQSPAFPATSGARPSLASSSGTTLTVAWDNLVRGLNVGATDTAIGGSSFGTLTIQDAALSGPGRALSLTTGTLAATLSGITTTSSTAEALRLSGVGGSLTAVSGSLANTSLPAIDLTASNLALALQNTAVTQSNGQSAIKTTNMTGGSLVLSGTSSVTVSGTNAANDAIVIDGNGSNAYTVTIPAVSISANNMRHGLTLGDLVAGSAVTIAGGTIAATGVGDRVVNFASATNGTYDLSSVTLSGSASSGIALTTSQRGTYRFGSFTVDNPSGGVGFQAQGTDATVEFRSFSQNGGSTGISLTSTTGHFTVLGQGTTNSGGTIQNLTGADSTSAGVGVWLSGANDVELNWMRLNSFENFGIRGATVSGFTLANSTVEAVSTLNGTSNSVDEGSVSFSELTGTASISASTIRDGLENNMVVQNTSGSLTLNVTTSTFKENSLAAATRCSAPNGCGNAGLLVEANGTAAITTSVTDSTFTNHRGNHFQASANDTGQLNVTFKRNTLSGSNANVLTQSVLVAGGSGSNVRVTYEIADNTMTGTRGGSAINIFKGGVVGDTGNSNGSFVGTIARNTIGTLNVPNSGTTASNAIHLEALGIGTFTALVENNNVYEFASNGIYVEADTDGGGGGTYTALNVTVRNNIVQRPATTVSSSGYNGIQLNGGTLPGDSRTICFDVSGNSAAGSGKGTAGLNDDLRVRQRQATTVRLPGYGGSNSDNAAAASYLMGRNTASTAVASNTVPTGGGFAGGAACTLAPISVASAQPGTIQAVALAPAMAEIAPVAAVGLDQHLGAPRRRPAAAADVVTLQIPVLPAGRRVVLRFDARINSALPTGVTQLSMQATVSADGIAAVLSDDPGLPGAADATLTNVNVVKLVYLPLVAGRVDVPDLVVTSMTLSPNKTKLKAGEPVVVTVVIENRGKATAAPFWVDLYINPDHTPQVNETWSRECTLQPCLGLVWAVTRTVAPGESITLTSAAGGFDTTFSRWPGWLAAGTTDIAVFADSYNPRGAGASTGDLELSNNVLGIHGLSVTGPNPPLAPSAVVGAGTRQLPQR